MDAVSYSLASKQAQRIEKFIENPDSTSGIVTVPKIIASGETVTVPAGRVAVLPNVQVDGELTVEGEVFIPSGSSVDFSNGIKVNGEKLTMSIPTAYHIYNGEVTATNTVVTNCFATKLYTGTGGTQSINTDVDMSTQWGNDASETFGGLVWIKNRSNAVNNFLFDTIRGTLNEINSNNTEAQELSANSLTEFRSTGYYLGSSFSTNSSGFKYVSWNFQTTHRTSGITNHGKLYTCHYNPYTGFTIIKYTGSGLAGHEIPHSLGRKLGFVTVKNLSAVTNWFATYQGNENNVLLLNLTNANAALTTGITSNTDEKITISTDLTVNTSANDYIMYGWANSYLDENNTLIGNYEVGIYQGTGVAGNKVTTRGKPAWVMIKSISVVGNWSIKDNQRGSTQLLYADSSVAEETAQTVDLLSDGFTIQTTDSDMNTSGGQYLYMVVYDNDSGSGKSKYPRATDTTNLAINALVPYANGIDVNGSKVSIEYKNETITGLTLTQGKNYVYSKNDGTYGAKPVPPSYGTENPLTSDFFNLNTLKWYDSTNAEITPRTYLDCVVYADHNGQVSYVEELSKTTYFDEVKANEFKGKNACTAWANIDMTTTPPTIRDSYGITGIIRTATGKLSGYINMDRSDYIVIGSGEISQDGVNASPSIFVNPSRNLLNTTSQFNIEVRGTDNNNYNAKLLEVFIIGGKN